MPNLLSSDALPLGSRIRQARQRQHLKIKDLAEKISKTPNYISRLENSHSQPSDDLLREIAEVCNVSYQWLKNGSGRIDDDASSNSALAKTDDGHETSDSFAYTRDKGAEQDLDDRFFLHILHYCQPKMFPEAVGILLNMEPDTLTKFLDKEADCKIDQGVVEVLSKRIDLDMVELQMDAVKRLVTKIRTTADAEVVETAINDYLNRYENGVYSWTKSSDHELQDGEYSLPDCTVAIHTLIYKGVRQGNQTGTAMFRFQYVQVKGTISPMGTDEFDQRYDYLQPDGMNRYKELVIQRLPKLKPGPKKKASTDEIKRDFFVFTNEVIQNRFCKSLGFIQTDREIRRRGSAPTEKLPDVLTLKVEEGSAVLKSVVPPLPPSAIPTVQNYLSENIGIELVCSKGYPKFEQYHPIRAYGYVLDFRCKDAPESERQDDIYVVDFVRRDQMVAADMEPAAAGADNILLKLQMSIDAFYSAYTVQSTTYVLDKELYPYFRESAKELQQRINPSGCVQKYRLLLLDEECDAVADSYTFEW